MRSVEKAIIWENPEIEWNRIETEEVINRDIKCYDFFFASHTWRWLSYCYKHEIQPNLKDNPGKQAKHSNAKQNRHSHAIFFPQKWSVSAPVGS